VTSILLPSDPADILAAMQELTLFDQLEVTDEDRKRADMMREERDREAFGAQISHGDFLKALDLKVDLFRAKTEDLGRVTQLINKTNQYNLTTIRRTLDEVRALANSDDWRLYAFRVTDKFGEYGLVGVIIIQVSSDKRRWTIDSLMMSCRVLGRGVEQALIGGLAADARAEGAAEFVGSYIPTAKNAICKSFLPDQGFTQTGEREWRLDLAGAPAVPAHITRLGSPNATTVQLADVTG
jgi:FkbH-like protein